MVFQQQYFDIYGMFGLHYDGFFVFIKKAEEKIEKDRETGKRTKRRLSCSDC